MVTWKKAFQQTKVIRTIFPCKCNTIMQFHSQHYNRQKNNHKHKPWTPNIDHRMSSDKDIAAPIASVWFLSGMKAFVRMNSLSNSIIITTRKTQCDLQDEPIDQHNDKENTKEAFYKNHHLIFPSSMKHWWWQWIHTGTAGKKRNRFRRMMGKSWKKGKKGKVEGLEQEKYIFFSQYNRNQTITFKTLSQF